MSLPLEFLCLCSVSCSDPERCRDHEYGTDRFAAFEWHECLKPRFFTECKNIHTFLGQRPAHQVHLQSRYGQGRNWKQEFSDIQYLRSQNRSACVDLLHFVLRVSYERCHGKDQLSHD
jgi:hypothetical protein